MLLGSQADDRESRDRKYVLVLRQRYQLVNAYNDALYSVDVAEWYDATLGGLN